MHRISLHSAAAEEDLFVFNEKLAVMVVVWTGIKKEEEDLFV